MFQFGVFKKRGFWSRSRRKILKTVKRDLKKIFSIQRKEGIGGVQTPKNLLFAHQKNPWISISVLLISLTAFSNFSSMQSKVQNENKQSAREKSGKIFFPTLDFHLTRLVKPKRNTFSWFFILQNYHNIDGFFSSDESRRFSSYIWFHIHYNIKIYFYDFILLRVQSVSIQLRKRMRYIW